MGRDVTGLRVASVKVKPISTETIKTKVVEVNNEAKDNHVKEGTTVTTPVKSIQEKQDLLGVKSPKLGAANHDLEPVKVEDQKSSSPEKELATPDKHVMKPAKVEDKKPNSVLVGNGRTSQAARKAVELEPEKRACVSPIAAKTPMSGGEQSSPEADNIHSPKSSKKSQLNSPFLSRKYLDDEDCYSLASSAASARTTRSRTTVAVAPTFKIHERLERRKEFYTKLELKQKALEEEKREYEARTKEEEAAAIKQLRRNMVVKAKPVPSFYYKGPPPKKELKKLPTTRAVSPKFNRRKSCGDVALSPCTEEKTVCTRTIRHSIGNCGEQSTPTSTSKDRRLSDQNGSSSGKYKDRLKPVKDPKSLPPKLTQQAAANIAVQS